MPFCTMVTVECFHCMEKLISYTAKGLKLHPVISVIGVYLLYRFFFFDGETDKYTRISTQREITAAGL